MLRPAVLLAISCGVVLASLLSLATAAEGSDYYRRFPWPWNKTALITQGYGTGSHINQDYYALDFDIEGAGVQGTATAATAGLVQVVLYPYCAPGSRSYGNYADIQIKLPAGETRFNRYAHLASVSVSGLTGVARGQKIGIEGDTGDVQTCGGYHLHFRETTSQNCFSSGCARVPEPMSGKTDVPGLSQPITSDNFFAKADFSGNGCPDVLGRNQNYPYKLVYWPGKCDGSVGTGVFFGGGWDDYELLLTPGDFSGDGCADIIARHNSTYLMYYWRGNCQAGASFGGQIGIGSWAAYNWLFAP